MSRIIETEKKERDEQNTPLVSEYKIGHTTYIVELHFNFERGETLNDVIQRLINKEVEAISLSPIDNKHSDGRRIVYTKRTLKR